MRVKTSKYKGVYLTRETPKNGVVRRYWVAHLYVGKKSYVRRCLSEEHALEEYNRMLAKYKPQEAFELRNQ